MPFLDIMKPFKGKRIKSIEMEGKLVKILFTDRWGSALYFTKKGKYVCLGITNRGYKPWLKQKKK